MMAGGGSRPQPVQFNIRSDDWDALLAAVEKTKAAMRKNQGLADVDTTYRAGRPLLSVQVDRDRAAAVGLPAAARRRRPCARSSARTRSRPTARRATSTT